MRDSSRPWIGSRKKEGQALRRHDADHGPLFILFLLAVIVIVTLLQYLPALALGPIAEHFFAAQGQTF